MSRGVGIKDSPRALKIAWTLFKHGRDGLFRGAATPPELAALETEEGLSHGDPESLAADLENLGPTFVKLGQLLASRGDLVPPAYRDALRRLQDDVGSFSTDTVREIFEQDVGVSVSTAFATFEETPLASASMAQVHAATLRDGRKVVVKVQRPEARSQVLQDTALLARAAGWLDGYVDFVDLKALADEFRRSLLRELDFERERENLRRMRDLLDDFDRLEVPEPFPDFTGPKVLTMERVQGTKVTELHPAVLIDLDGTELADQLFKAYLRQTLVEGFLHADPHPGNVLITRDHRVALVDLGMVTEISSAMRENLLSLMVAISEGDGATAAKAAMKLTATSEVDEDFDEAGFRRDLERLVGQVSSHTVGDLEIGRAVLQVNQIAARNGARVPYELTFLGKALLHLDEIGKCLAPDYDPNATIRQYTAALSQETLRESLSFGSILPALLDVKNLVEKMPSRLNTWLTSVSKDGIRVDVNALDEEILIQGIQKIANRISTALILAAMIVGAAMLVDVPSDTQLFGYPALAIILFLGAVTGGLGLIWSIARSDR